MRNKNYRDALRKAKTGFETRVNVPGSNNKLPKKQDGNFGVTTPHQTIIEDFNNNGIPDYLEVKQTIPMVGASNVPVGQPGVIPVTQIGGDNYMAALKAYKKGGQTK